jgi:hypothetical protein
VNGIAGETVFFIATDHCLAVDTVQFADELPGSLRLRSKLFASEIQYGLGNEQLGRACA